MKAVEDRFDEKYITEPNSGCWLWTGWTRGKGYGVFTVDGVHVPAHRFSYERWVGKIPSGAVIDHLCRVPFCVNPQHLEAVTNQENVKRGALLKTHCPQGHPYSGDNLYLYNGRHRQCKTCRRDHGFRHFKKQRSDTGTAANTEASLTQKKVNP